MAQHTRVVHDTLAAGQGGQAGGSECRRGQRRKAQHENEHKGADAFCKLFHAKGSTSFTPTRPPSTLAGKPPTSFW